MPTPPAPRSHVTLLPPVDADRESRRAWVEQRLGQGTFRTRVTDAYGRLCAVTGERTLPVLEAAHISPYAQQGPNRVDNGLLPRSDLHRLFDRGLVTIEPERLTFRVSDRIRDEYNNDGCTLSSRAGRWSCCRTGSSSGPTGRSSNSIGAWSSGRDRGPDHAVRHRNRDPIAMVTAPTS